MRKTAGSQTWESPAGMRAVSNAEVAPVQLSGATAMALKRASACLDIPVKTSEM